MAGEYQVVLLPRATEDIDNVLRYLLADYGAAAAENAFRTIQEGLSKIARMPGARPVYATTERDTYRSYEAKKYRIVYSVSESENHVIVITVRHVRMSREAILRAIEEE